eukprot:scaffold6310_cov67-Phaeocystis_antarctica.AAC.12
MAAGSRSAAVQQTQSAASSQLCANSRCSQGSEEWRLRRAREAGVGGEVKKVRAAGGAPCRRAATCVRLMCGGRASSSANLG